MLESTKLAIKKATHDFRPQSNDRKPILENVITQNQQKQFEEPALNHIQKVSVYPNHWQEKKPLLASHLFPLQGPVITLVPIHFEYNQRNATLEISLEMQTKP